MDVVPVETGWDTDPFEPQIINDRIYARGSEAMIKRTKYGSILRIKIIKELGLPVSKRVRFIIGTDEESELEMYGPLLPNRRNARLWFLTRRNIPNHQW